MSATAEPAYLHPEARSLLGLLKLAASSSRAPTAPSPRSPTSHDRVALVRRWIRARNAHTPVGLLEEAGEDVAAAALRRLTSHGDFARATWHLAGVLVEDR